MVYNISEKNKILELEIQQEINECFDKFTSFCFDAGAGAGKTYALKKSIEYVLKKEGKNLKLRNQKILCITYTNAAKDEIISRLGKNSTVIVSTIHEFLWEFILKQQELLTLEHKEKVREEINRIESKINENSLFCLVELTEFRNIVSDEEFLYIFYKYYSNPAAEFRKVIIKYNIYFKKYLKNISIFKEFVKDINKKRKFDITLKEIEEGKSKKIIYNPLQNKDKLENYVISHDTLLVYCKNIITNQKMLKRLFSDRYPYVLIDEYQDTDANVVSIIDSIREFSNSKKNFVVGFFGDVLQNIYKSGVGSLPKKEDYKIIKKNFNRRSSTQIVELIEKIRNDDFGQKSIYTEFNSGSYNFYVCYNEFDLQSFLKDNELNFNTACLLMTNNEISIARGFDLLLKNLREFPRFKGMNYENISNEFLQKNKRYIGWFLRDILTFMDFIKKIDENSATIIDMLQFTTIPKSTLTFGEMKKFITKIREINFSSLTFYDCIREIANIKGKISGESILNKIFSIDSIGEDILFNIKNNAYDYFYFSQDLEDDSLKNFNDLDSFFKLKVSQFINWYNYIVDNYKNENINYYTLHGSKGLEFENVVVIIRDVFAKRKNYCRYFFENYNSNTCEDQHYNEVRNLLYVAFSRAKINLHVIYKLDASTGISEGIAENIKYIFDDYKILE